MFSESGPASTDLDDYYRMLYEKLKLVHICLLVHLTFDNDAQTTIPVNCFVLISQRLGVFVVFKSGLKVKTTTSQ